jgi:Raf kinase inhibitor-like YbhB/YbcL family protein
MTTLTLASAAFAEGQAIPFLHTCDGRDRSPPLAWSDPPAGTKSFALIADDPDAPGKTWVHWVLYNVPAAARGLPEAVPANRQLADGSKQGINDSGDIGYGGPCPPSGVHRYYFKLYALDALLQFDRDARKPDVERAMKGHVLAHAQLMGTYQRTRR